jgi:hypothetical protein
MDISRISSVIPGTSAANSQPQAGGADTALSLASAVRRLNNATTGDGVFTVGRDPVTHRFVVSLRDRTTGELIDQFPPETILRMAEETETPSVTTNGESPK